MHLELNARLLQLQASELDRQSEACNGLTKFYECAKKNFEETTWLWKFKPRLEGNSHAASKNVPAFCRVCNFKEKEVRVSGHSLNCTVGAMLVLVAV